MAVISFDDKAVRETAPMARVIEGVKDALIGMVRNEFDFPQRIVGCDGGALVMPVFHRPSQSTVTKILSLDADRDPFINGVVSWTAKGNLMPLVADAVAVTTLRTGAITGVAVDLLARDDAETLTLFGAGAQSFDQVRAVLAVRSIKHVTIVSRNLDRARVTAALLADEYPSVNFHATTEGRQSLHLADIVVCATTATSPLFSLAELGEKVMVAAIGSYRKDMEEVPQDLLGSGCPIYVDSVQACMHEAGELVRAVDSGAVQRAHLIPLGLALLNGAQKGERCVFKSVGIAAQDWAAMKVIQDEFARRTPHDLPQEIAV